MLLPGVPVYVSILFVCTTVAGLWLFARAAPRHTLLVWVLAVWPALQALLALTGFYINTHTVPPRFSAAIAPPVLLMVFLFSSAKGRAWLSTFHMQQLVLLSVIRIPVEITLYLLFKHQTIPELMTFSGANFDIFSGITAPVLYWVCFKNGQVIRKTILLLWNVVCLLLLLNVVIRGVLSVPFSFQRFGFDQPNIAVLYFPFIWLPCTVVPLVLFSHLVMLWRLLKQSPLPNSFHNSMAGSK